MDGPTRIRADNMSVINNCSRPESQLKKKSNSIAYHFSREVIFPEDSSSQKRILPIEKLDSLRPHLPDQIDVLIYEYYKHAYPKEQVDVDALEIYLEENFELVQESKKDLIWLRSFERSKN